MVFAGSNERAHAKCRLRAPCLPPKSRPYHGNLASTEGDMAAPVAICRGARTKITRKYASF